MSDVQPEAFIQACAKIMACPKANGYAKAYAKEALRMGAGTDRHTLEVQALYILNNITGWRGEGHKEVRQLLKDFSVNARG